MAWLLARMGEGSTHAGLAAMVAALTPILPPQYQLISQSIAVALGGAAFGLKDKGRR